MTDTAPEIKEKVRQQIMSRPPDERFVIGAQMFDAAMEMLKASLPVGLPKVEERRQIFKRLYGLELPG
jgi:hypothetical protein